MQAKFQLEEFIPEILKIATANNISPDEAMTKFVINLTTLREHYKGGSESLDYNRLGQKWNSLTSKERNAQKVATKTRLFRYRAGGSNK